MCRPFSFFSQLSVRDCLALFGDVETSFRQISSTLCAHGHFFQDSKLRGMLDQRAVLSNGKYTFTEPLYFDAAPSIKFREFEGYVKNRYPLDVVLVDLENAPPALLAISAACARNSGATIVYVCRASTRKPVPSFSRHIRVEIDDTNVANVADVAIVILTATTGLGDIWVATDDQFGEALATVNPSIAHLRSSVRF